MSSGHTGARNAGGAKGYPGYRGHKEPFHSRGWAAADDWVSLHVYHWGDQDLVLSRAVSPLVRGLEEAGLLRGWFFQRSGEGGPHIRLRLLPAQPVQRGAVRRAAEGRLAAHLAAHPTAAPAAASSYAASVTAYARAHGVDAADRSVRAADTLEEVPYVREPDWYGYGEAVTAVERHFAQSSNLALSLLAETATRQARMNVALAHLTMALAASGLSIADCARLTDPQVVLASPRPSERRRIAGEAQATYRARGASLREQTRRLWTAGGGPGAAAVHEDADLRAHRARGTGPAAAWSHSVRTLATRLVTLSAEGAYAPAGLGELYPDSAWKGTRRPPGAAIAVHHVLGRAAHQFTNRVGIGCRQETYLRLLLAQALHDLARPGRP
ncbi:lantibiotic dehydratase C-terminal domain-containing protein [Streptomyces sp. 4.24]|uniref:lantibiotic dehydratase C-terminal domain-containing protein n=1 Tax=Streptomyces tritrimontium TaxID=3406573 RepID=UPI003BB7DB62